ncbi:MAG: hypothetical protein H6P96_646 [Candidatus Aminicenantes bacterium]|jgi:uncharacterized protein YndB with AHSA1/START domain|nr:hypothetical protein [Candidatus Aminicenantes bacterium]
MGNLEIQPGSRVEVDHDAPATGIAEVLIKAPIDTVWRILSDLEKWPSWNKSVSKIRVNGPLEAGTSFDWTAGSSRIVSRLEEVDPPQRIVWSGRMPGIRAIHVWELKADGDGTRVRTEESFEGLIVGLLRGLMKKTLAKALAQGTAALKAAAESR